jgi:hypothetical protein
MRPTLKRLGELRKVASVMRLVGSYLTQIGLSENAVVYITQAAPTEMTWLNLREAKQIGIEVLPFEEQTPATKPAPPVTSREASNQENKQSCSAVCQRNQFTIVTHQCR